MKQISNRFVRGLKLMQFCKQNPQPTKRRPFHFGLKLKCLITKRAPKNVCIERIEKSYTSLLKNSIAPLHILLFIFAHISINILETYSISFVEQLTGIKAHTLRIWEKRYKYLVPHRTPTNIRFYDDLQLKRLLNISTLLQNGYKISSVSILTDEELNELIISLFNHNTHADVNELYVNILTNHMLSFDERSFDKVLSSAIIKLGFYEAVIQVIYPFLRKSGILWITSNAAPSQEHFASNIIKRKLFAAIDGIPYPAIPKGKFALFLPPGEWHEIGLLVSDFLIRSAGWETIYLGQNVPYNSLEIVLNTKKINHLITFFTCIPDVEKEASAISAISLRHNVVTFMCIATTMKNEFKNLISLESPSALFSYL